MEKCIKKTLKGYTAELDTTLENQKGFQLYQV